MSPPAPATTRRHTVLTSPVGELTLAADGDALVGLWLPRHRRPAGFDLGAADPGPFRRAAEQLGQYFAGERTAFDLPLAPAGPAFARSVWALLTAIPYGQTRTYGDLARELGRPGAAQAVGAANGANPISIVVPCHRVVGAGGALTGYAGGLDAKRALLAMEAANPRTAGADRLF